MSDFTRRQQIFKSMRTVSTLDGASDGNNKRHLFHPENSHRNENGLNKLKSVESGDSLRINRTTMQSNFLVARMQNERRKGNAELEFNSMRLIPEDRLGLAKTTSVQELDAEIKLFKEKGSDHNNTQAKRPLEQLSKLSLTRSEKGILTGTFSPLSRQEPSNAVQKKEIPAKEHKRDFSSYSGILKQEDQQQKNNETVVKRPMEKQIVNRQRMMNFPQSNIKESAVIETIKVNPQGQKTVRYHFIKPENKIQDHAAKESNFRRSPRMKLKDYLHMAENSARKASIQHSSKNKMNAISPALKSKYPSQTMKHKTYKEEKYKITNKQMLTILQQEIEMDLQSVNEQVKRIQTFLSDMVKSDIELNDDELLILYHLRHEIKQKMISSMRATFENPHLMELVQRSRNSVILESKKANHEEFSMPNDCLRSNVNRHP